MPYLTLPYLTLPYLTWGHLDPSSIVLVSASLPLPGCSLMFGTPDQAKPLSLSQALAMETRYAPRHPYSPIWRNNARVNMLAEMIASGAGVSYVDTAALSMQRPDGAMGAHSTRASTSHEDCMHFCLPGVPDIFTQMVVSVLASRKGLGPPPPLPRPNRASPRMSAFVFVCF